MSDCEELKCLYLFRGDWMGDAGGLLWDQCKECEVNWEEE